MTINYFDTIAGMATPPGEAGISIVRISGENAVSIAGEIFRAKNRSDIRHLPNQRLVYGWIEKDGKSIDEVLLCVMKKPHSFTAEDVVEIHCHGGSFITGTILELVLSRGARLAGPGEFTQRAFLNGRLDLTQAEAVNDLVHARTALALEIGVNQLKGKLYEEISAIKSKLADILALINANIDFPEEDVVFAESPFLKQELEKAAAQLRKLVESADAGIKIRNGCKVVLAGKPNAGKSTIMNALLQESRSIVSRIPGTTRDTIEESCDIQGIPVSLVDTAGIRPTVNPIEKQGVDRAVSSVRKADLILWIVDISASELEINPPLRLDLSEISTLLVLNKRDLCQNEDVRLPYPWSDFPRICISALENEDIQKLKEEIFGFISGGQGNLNEETMLTNLRQKQSAEEALKSLSRILERSDKGAGEEFIAADLSLALRSLGEIAGETTPDDMLSLIFSQFCIGK